MRIVDRTALMKLPPGTLYHECELAYFKALHIKGETCPPDEPPGYSGDWYTQEVPSLLAHNSDEESDAWYAMFDDGASHPIDLDYEGREALYDAKLRYAVWERDDVLQLQAKLAKCIETGYPAPCRHDAAILDSNPAVCSKCGAEMP